MHDRAHGVMLYRDVIWLDDCCRCAHLFMFSWRVRLALHFGQMSGGPHNGYYELGGEEIMTGSDTTPCDGFIGVA